MKRLTPDAEDARFIRRIVFLILIAALAVAVYRIGNLLILAFGSILGATAIRAVADRLQRHLSIAPRYGIALALVIGIGAAWLLGWLFVSQFGDQINALIAQTPVLVDRLGAWLSQSVVGARIVAGAQAAYAGSQAAQDVGVVVKGSAELALNTILLVVGALFFAIEPRRYREGLLLLVPKDKRATFRDALDDLARQLRLWLRAQIILMVVMGVLVGFGLWLAGVPSAAALGLLAGLSEFIPYIGPTVAMLPALGLGAVAGTGPLIGAITTYAIVRLLHDNLITPYVQNRVVSIPPAITLFAIVGIGLIFGLYGLIFSAPLLVAIFSLTRSLYLRETIGEKLSDPD